MGDGPQDLGTSGPLDFVLVGRVVKPHGLRGDVVVEPATDFGEDRFNTSRRLRVGGYERQVTEARPHGGRWVVRFDGINSVDDAEALRGADVELAEAEARRALGEGGYFLHDLIGCDVRVEDGASVGTVARVYEGAAQPVLGVDGTRGEVLVPLVDAICREVDLDGRRIVIAPPDGLLDANAGERRG